MENWGLLFAFAGVTGFALTLPATGLALAELPVMLLGPGRVWPAAALALAVLLGMRSPLPGIRHWPGLLFTGCASGLVFPLLLTSALQVVPASHAAVIFGALPFVNALVARLRHGEKSDALFWVFSALGALGVMHFAWQQHDHAVVRGDGLLIIALFVASAAYSEGTRLSVPLGSWQVISWSMVFAFPASMLFMPVFWQFPLHASWPAWLAYAYVATISQWLAYGCWYQGLKTAGFARAGQLQLLQMFFSMAASALLLRETLALALWLHAVFVSVCLGLSLAVKSRRV